MLHSPVAAVASTSGGGGTPVTQLLLALLKANLSAAIGLAAIVGAYAAGLILEDVHYQDFTKRGEHGLEDLLHPIGAFLVPIFFVLMGMRVDPIRVRPE